MSPFLNQVYEGFGFPSTTQIMVASCPLSPLMSEGSTTNLGSSETWSNMNKKTMIWPLINNSHNGCPTFRSLHFCQSRYWPRISQSYCWSPEWRFSISEWSHGFQALFHCWWTIWKILVALHTESRVLNCLAFSTARSKSLVAISANCISYVLASFSEAQSKCVVNTLK